MQHFRKPFNPLVIATIKRVVNSRALSAKAEPLVTEPPQQESDHENPKQSESETTNQYKDFLEFFHAHHIPTTFPQRALLTLGSMANSILDPTRADAIATLAETIGTPSMVYCKQKMSETVEGATILKEQPRINSSTVNLDMLKDLPENTLGKAYSNFLETNNVTPDSRLPVQFVDDPELAYVIQRYREVHDLIHTVLGMPTNMLGEITVKWVEAIQTKLPMCIGGAVFGPIRLRPNHRNKYLQIYMPWAIQTGATAKFLLGVHYEKRWEQPMDDLLRELNIKPLIVQTSNQKPIEELNK